MFSSIIIYRSIYEDNKYAEQIEKRERDTHTHISKHGEIQGSKIKVNKDINLKIESLLTHKTLLSAGLNTIQHASINPIVASLPQLLPNSASDFSCYLLCKTFVSIIQR